MRYYFKCPKCNQDEEFYTPAEQDNGLGCLLFLIGGLLIALLYQSDRQRRIQCGACRYIFRQPVRPRPGISILALWIFWLAAFSAVVCAGLTILPEVMPDISKYPILSNLESFIASNPRAVAVTLAAVIVFVAVLMPIISFISTLLFRTRLKKKYHLKPTQYQPPRNENTPKAPEDNVHSND